MVQLFVEVTLLMHKHLSCCKKTSYSVHDMAEGWPGLSLPSWLTWSAGQGNHDCEGDQLPRNPLAATASLISDQLTALVTNRTNSFDNYQ
jgi:hypothetical protein